MEPIGVVHEEPIPLVDRVIAPYFRDSALWPVTLVLLAHAVLGIGLAAVDAWRSGMGYGLVSIVGLAAASLVSWLRDLRRRRFGLTSRTLLGCWIVGLACAFAADRYALY